jgi:hypothetical protein
MARFFHVGFHFAGQPKIKDLEAPMAVAGDWVRYASQCWILWTEKTPQQIYSIIKPYLSQDDQFLIAEMNMSDRYGWLPEWIWKWINDRVAFQPSALGVAPSPYYNPFAPPPSPFLPPYDPFKK